MGYNIFSRQLKFDFAGHKFACSLCLSHSIPRPRAHLHRQIYSPGRKLKSFDISGISTALNMFGEETQVPLGESIARSLNRASSHGSQSNLALDSHGDENTLEYRIKAVDKTGSAKPISLWHDVTLVHVDPATDRPTPYLNFVCEIPKFSR